MLLWLLAFAIVCAITVLAADNFDAHKDVTLYAATTAVGRIPVSLLLFLAVNMTAGTKKMSERHNLSGLESLRGVTTWLPKYDTYSAETTTRSLQSNSWSDIIQSCPPPKYIGIAKKLPFKGIFFHTMKFLGTQFLQDYLNIASLANLATVE
ncbi:hypothetical protein M441DRAFT_46695 [Trichoderma asperellum CBS 433.97]|uniref:Amino acid permease/ SLC12A domain-containing protein n=1 Tax=Trichoderma asperellum (strain ATCC 204424 / CBS 433.97 / NBRC 101777) TaxID=1042311 RepID=A0A2T3Z9R1_TRIA4|nr:hypothetical protein M441DRAFT_46695 [Trichoderma asperellum CBS 433.97]PTB41548.1 hypothetical protein M441DRAFT_46695 [Trichoderma asperellum CBS 433.97]